MLSDKARQVLDTIVKHINEKDIWATVDFDPLDHLIEDSDEVCTLNVGNDETVSVLSFNFATMLELVAFVKNRLGKRLFGASGGNYYGYSHFHVKKDVAKEVANLVDEGDVI